MKKFIAFLMAMMLMFSMTACELFATTPTEAPAGPTTSVVDPTTAPTEPSTTPTEPSVPSFILPTDRPSISTPSEAVDILKPYGIVFTFVFKENSVLSLELNWTNGAETETSFNSNYMIVITQGDKMVYTHTDEEAFAPLNNVIASGETLTLEMLFDMVDSSEISVHVLTADGTAYITILPIYPDAAG